MITIVTDRQQIHRYQKLLQEKLGSFFTEKIAGKVGYPGGSWEGNMMYSSELDMWTAEQVLNNRYWNGFGISRPVENKQNAVIGEVNIPFEGIKRRTAGVFGVDDEGNVLVLHRGILGGGNKGVDKNFFISDFKGPLLTVKDGARQSSLCLVCDLSSSSFDKQLKEFISQVALIKRKAKDPAAIALDKIIKYQFSRESFGQSVVDRKGTTEYNRIHGKVVNKLADELASLGMSVQNDRQRDLCVSVKNKATILFEIKTSSASQCIYTGVGQLLVYSIALDNNVKRILVLPDKLMVEVEKRLRELDIELLYYEWKNKNPEFNSIDLKKIANI
ncbi:MAG: hypothetical protein DI539_19785 [Flavobacterium psychrophilum]|nr:MAG: hypothetical protein DI539_19785 [Flavobacterium psychrophilum]